MLQKYKLYPEELALEGEALKHLQCRAMPVMWNCYLDGKKIGLVFARKHRSGMTDWHSVRDGKVYGAYDYEADAVRKLVALEWSYNAEKMV